MKLIIATLVFMSTSAFASFTEVPSFSNKDFKNQSQWAMAMTGIACGIDVDESNYGTSQKISNGVIYTVFDASGNEVASAYASNKTIFSKKSCL